MRGAALRNAALRNGAARLRSLGSVNGVVKRIDGKWIYLDNIVKRVDTTDGILAG